MAQDIPETRNTCLSHNHQRRKFKKHGPAMDVALAQARQALCPLPACFPPGCQFKQVFQKHPRRTAYCTERAEEVQATTWLSLVNSSQLRSGQEGHVLSFRRPCLQNFKYWLKAVLRNYSRLCGLRTPLRSIQVTSKALSGKGTASKSAQPVLTPDLKPNQPQLLSSANTTSPKLVAMHTLSTHPRIWRQNLI